jgi:rhodanese-related sulfurtransferase
MVCATLKADFPVMARKASAKAPLNRMVIRTEMRHGSSLAIWGSQYMQFILDDYGQLILPALFAAVVLVWLVSQARMRQNLRWVETQDLASQLKGKNNITVVDVRTQGEFKGQFGHIKNAKNIPLHDLSRRINELSAYKDRPIVVVCRTDRRAASAAVLLRNAGMKDVSVLRGGMMMWSQLGKTGERGSSV